MEKMEQPQDVLKYLILDKFIEIVENVAMQANELGLEGKTVSNIVIEENGDEVDVTLEYDDPPEREDK